MITEIWIPILHDVLSRMQTTRDCELMQEHMNEDIGRYETPYHAIADATRRQMLDLLRTQGPLRAGEIVAHFPQISQPAVSKHLRVLRQAQLVHSTKCGREQWYHLNPMPLQWIAAWLEEYEALWDQRLDRLKQVAEQTAPKPTSQSQNDPSQRRKPN